MTISRFGLADMNVEIVDDLAAVLTNPDSSDRKIAGVSYILSKIVPARLSVPRLVQIRNHPSQRTQHWVVATLGQMSPTAIRLHVNDAELAA